MDVPSASRDAKPAIALAMALVAAVSGVGAFALGRLVRAPLAPAPEAAPEAAPIAAPIAASEAAPLRAALDACDDALASVERWPRPARRLARLQAARAALPEAVRRAPPLALPLDLAAPLARLAGDGAAAQALVEEAVALDPEPLRVGLRRAAGDRTALRRAAAASFDAEWPVATVQLLAALLEEVGERDAAVRLLDRAIDRFPQEVALRCSAAELRLDGDPDGHPRARELLAGALALRPTAQRALFLELHLLLTADAPSSAIALLQAAERRLPEVADVALALGFALLRGRYFQEARGRFERALELDPQRALAAAAIGSSFIEEEETYQAIGALQRALLLDDEPYAHDELARAYWESGNRERGDAVLDAAIERHGDHPLLRDHHAASLGARGRHAEAIAGLREAFRRAPFVAEVVNDLAWELATSGDPTLRRPGEALRLAERACAIEPESAWYRNTLGVACYRVGDFARALEVLEQAVELPRGGGPLDHLFLAMARAQLGDREGALREFADAEAVVERRDGEYRRLRAEAAALLGVELPEEPAGEGRERSGRRERRDE